MLEKYNKKDYALNKSNEAVLFISGPLLYEY